MFYFRTTKTDQLQLLVSKFNEVFIVLIVKGILHFSTKLQKYMKKKITHFETKYLG